MRDFTNFNGYMDELAQDVRAQPPDKAHTEWSAQAALWFINSDFVNPATGTCSVLDVGCGQGFMQPLFEHKGLRWGGVTLGEDFEVANSLYPGSVYDADMSFLPFEDGHFDHVYARHVLEHSPFPIPTLMEWRRVAKTSLCLVSPAPAEWLWYGQNHYAMANDIQVEWWLKRAGWQPRLKILFNNRHPSYLKYLEPYQDAVRGEEAHGRDPGTLLRESYPARAVEFRYVCTRMDEPIRA